MVGVDGVMEFGDMQTQKSLFKVLYVQGQHGRNQRSLTALMFIMPANLVIVH